MAQPPNMKDDSRPLNATSASHGRGARQETLLLSDVPDVSVLLAEAASAPNANLSSASVAALGQRYDILGEAGHGSMGNVYKARDRETGETVALKLLKPEIASDQAMMERFKNELLFARKITHKNVCRVHEFNRAGGIAYTSMEFVEGESLRSVLNRFGGLPLRKAVEAALQICSGLKEAHAQGIVHRDLKPENVMIDTHGNVKIMDFGIARSMEALTRLTGSMVGTPAYMAPEQVAGKPVDYRTDVYSLGLMLYEIFTGTQAFQADTAIAVAMKQMRETPPLPREADPGIPVTIERTILKCLEKEPAKRFQSIGELEKVLQSPIVPGNSIAPPPVLAVHSSHAGTPLPAVALSQPPRAKGTSPVLWLLLGAFLIVAAFGARQSWLVWKSADQLPPPAEFPAPKPPDFALDAIVIQPAANKSAHAEPAEGKSARTNPANARSLARTSAASVPPAGTATKEVFPRVELPGRKTPPSRDAQQTAAMVTPGVQQRANKAFGEAGSGKSGGQQSLWVGRFEREDRADEAAKRITDLGLPVTVIPRHGTQGQFFVVVTGPFAQSRMQSVKQWLETQGFHGVHPIQRRGANAKPPVSSGPKSNL